MDYEFKIVDKETGAKVPNPREYLIDSEGVVRRGGTDYAVNGKLEAVLYTGVKDMYGNKIYDGDTLYVEGITGPVKAHMRGIEDDLLKTRYWGTYGVSEEISLAPFKKKLTWPDLAVGTPFIFEGEKLIPENLHYTCEDGFISAGENTRRVSGSGTPIQEVKVSLSLLKKRKE